MLVSVSCLHYESKPKKREKDERKDKFTLIMKPRNRIFLGDLINYLMQSQNCQRRHSLGFEANFRLLLAHFTSPKLLIL